MADEEPPQAIPPAAESAPVRGVLDCAPSGRAKCRACSEGIPKGAWRVGEITTNPFAEGETTYWFHSACAAQRRAAVWLAAIADAGSEVPVPEEVLAARPIAERGNEFPKLTRVTGIERAPSGRARCRHCRETIDKEALRVSLGVFNAGRFDALGFTHVPCLKSYVGSPVTMTDLTVRCKAFSADLASELEHLL